MDQAGLKVGVICRRDWPETGVRYPASIWMKRVGGKPVGGWRAPLSFASFLAQVFFAAIRARPRFIYCYDLHGIVAGGLVGEILQIPYIYHVHDIFLPEEGMGNFDRRLKPIERRLAATSLHLVFPSASKARLFLDINGITKPYCVVANAPMISSEVRCGFPEPSFTGRRIVLYQGSIGPDKGIEELVASLPDWPEECDLVLLGIVRPPGYVEKLQGLARAKQVEQRLSYLGINNYDRLFSTTRLADIGVFLPTVESVVHRTSGTAVNKVMEYMACGVPVLAASLPALSELMEETGAGVTINPTNPANIANAVRMMLEDRDRWCCWSENGRKAHLEKYNYETQFKPVLAMIATGKP